MQPQVPVHALAFLFLLAVSTQLARTQESAAAPTAPSHQDRLLVCNKAAHSLSIYDPATRKELAVLPTGQGPHEVAISPDGRTAVVSDYGAQLPGSTLTVIDVLAAKVLRTITLSEPVAEPIAGAAAGAAAGTGAEPKARTYLRPHGSSFVGPTHLVVTSESTRRLLLVDLAKDRVERTWTTPQQTMHMVALSPDRKHAFATSIKEGNVAWFDLGGAATPTTAPTIVPTGQGAEGLAVNPATGEAWVGNRAANTVSIVDPRTGKVTAELPTGDFPFRVAFANGGDQALVTCAESGDVHVFDGKQKKLLRAIEISGDASELSPLPMGITVDPDSRFAYVACGRGEFVAVIDLQQQRVVDRIASRAGPDGIGYARIVTKGL